MAAQPGLRRGSARGGGSPDVAGQLVGRGEPSPAAQPAPVGHLYADGRALRSPPGQQGVALLLQLLVQAQALGHVRRPGFQLRKDKRRELRDYGSRLPSVSSHHLLHASASASFLLLPLLLRLLLLLLYVFVVWSLRLPTNTSEFMIFLPSDNISSGRVPDPHMSGVISGARPPPPPPFPSRG